MLMADRPRDAEARSLPLVLGALTGIAVVVLLAPSLIVLLTSFTASPSLKFPPDGYSLRWYAALLDAGQMQQAAWNSLVVAAWATSLSVALGTAGARCIAGRRTRPLIGRGVGAGAFLAFMASFDNVPVSLFLADERTEVLPIHLWQQIETNLDVRTA